MQQAVANYLKPRHGRGRRMAEGTTAQGMDQRMQRILLRATLDADIRNCIFVLLKHMVERLGVQHDFGALLHELAADRKRFCEEKLGVSEVWHFRLVSLNRCLFWPLPYARTSGVSGPRPNPPWRLLTPQQWF